MALDARNLWYIYSSASPSAGWMRDIKTNNNADLHCAWCFDCASMGAKGLGASSKAVRLSHYDANDLAAIFLPRSSFLLNWEVEALGASKELHEHSPAESPW